MIVGFFAPEAMRDTATLQVPRSQGRFSQRLAEELDTIREEMGAERFDGGRFDDAASIMDELTTSDELTDFLTLRTYPMI